MSFRVADIVKIRIKFTYLGSPVTGLNSGFTLAAYKPDGSAVTGGDVTSAEVANGYYDVSIAAASVLTAGVYSVAVVSSVDSATVDSVWAFGQTEVDVVKTAGMVQFDRSTRGIATGTVGSGSTTTSIVTSVMLPAGAVANQFGNAAVARQLTFDMNTTTTALRGQATAITASTNAAAPVLTVAALSTAPVSGDTFCVT